MNTMTTFFDVAEVGSHRDLIAAHDALRGQIDHLARRNHAVPPDLRAAAEALEAEIMEARFDNLPI